MAGAWDSKKDCVEKCMKDLKCYGRRFVFYPYSNGKPLKYFNQNGYKILLISYIILMAEGRRDWRGARLKFGTSVRLYLFIFLTSLEYYDHCALFYSESRVYVSVSLKYAHFPTLK